MQRVCVWHLVSVGGALGDFFICFQFFNEMGMTVAIYPYMIKRKSVLNTLTDEEIQMVEAFKERANDLVVAVNKYKNVPVSRLGRNADGHVVFFDANTPDVDFVLILAAKFRFFFAQKEITCFEKISNLIRNNATDDWARSYIDWIKFYYKFAMQQNDVTKNLGFSVANQDIINLWFNSEFFHSDSDERIKLKSIHDAVGEVGSLFQLYTAILHCAVYVEKMYVVVHKFTKEHGFIYTPEHHFRPSINK